MTIDFNLTTALALAALIWIIVDYRKTAQVHKLINGRLDVLIETVKQLGAAEGRAAGIAEERERRRNDPARFEILEVPGAVKILKKIRPVDGR